MSTSFGYYNLIVIILSLLHVGSPAKQELRVAVMAPASPKDREFSLSKVKKAIYGGISAVESRGLLPNIEFNLTMSDTGCDSSLAPVAAFRIMNDGCHVFFGPVCDYSLAPVARYAPFWKIPVISPGGFAHDFVANKKIEYKTLTRVGAGFTIMSETILQVLGFYNWRKFVLLYDSDGQNNLFERFCYLASAAVVHKAKQRTSNLEPKFQLFSPFDNLEKIMKEEIGTKSAVVVLCASADSVRDIMIKAHDLNFDNGEYVFLNIDLFSSKNDSERPWFRKGEDEKNAKARKAYESLMTVTLRKPTSDEYRNFSEEVKNRAKDKDVNFTYGEEEVNSFVGAFHDAVILYAIALNETLANNGSISNGKEITARMWNRTFDGITGNVSIDDNGDRNADYSLLDMNPKTGVFEVVANYFGNKKEYKPEEERKIHWAGDRTSAPPDTPKCGFDGSKCPPDKPFPEYGIVIIVLGSLLVIVLIASFFIYRHIKLEAELAEMNWRVRWDDIMFGSLENDRKLKRQNSSTNNGDAYAEGRVLIERSDVVDQTWCKCGHCEDSDRLKRVCCRQLELFGIFHDDGRCITSTRHFQEVVLNKQVLLAVFIHVMLVQRQRGAAPVDLSPCKLRQMATRQFLCWMHRGQKLKKESSMSMPSCVWRAIRTAFPNDDAPEVSSSRGSCTTMTLAEIMPLDA